MGARKPPPLPQRVERGQNKPLLDQKTGPDLVSVTEEHLISGSGVRNTCSLTLSFLTHLTDHCPREALVGGAQGHLRSRS